MLTQLIVSSLLVLPSSTLKSVAPVATVKKLGYDVHYDPTTRNFEFWRDHFEHYEPPTYKIFKRFMNDNTVVLDVGCWIGLTAVWEGYVAGKVFALEPTPLAFSEMKRNLEANPGITGRVELINKALGAVDMDTEMTNNDNAMDHLVIDEAAQIYSGPKIEHAQAPQKVSIISINSLRKEHPELEKTGFVKIDTEGFERVIVPALEQFFKEKKPVAFISLHQQFVGREAVKAVVDKLAEIFPYLYEEDMVTPFNKDRASFMDGDHGGADVLCTWEPLQ